MLKRGPETKPHSVRAWRAKCKLTKLFAVRQKATSGTSSMAVAWGLMLQNCPLLMETCPTSKGVFTFLGNLVRELTRVGRFSAQAQAPTPHDGALLCASRAPTRAGAKQSTSRAETCVTKDSRTRSSQSTGAKSNSWPLGAPLECRVVHFLWAWMGSSVQCRWGRLPDEAPRSEHLRLRLRRRHRSGGTAAPPILRLRSK